MSDTLEEEKRRKLIEAGRRALEERKKKRQQTPDGTNIDVKAPNSAPVSDSLQSRRSDLEALRLSTLRAKQELELNKTTNVSTSFSVRNDKILSNGNSHPSQTTPHALSSPINSPKIPSNEQTSKISPVDPPSKSISDITAPTIPSKIAESSSSAVPNGTHSHSPKSDPHSTNIPNNGHSSSVPSLNIPTEPKQQANLLLSPFRPDSPLPSQQPASPILSPTTVFKPSLPLEATVPATQSPTLSQRVSQPAVPSPSASPAPVVHLPFQPSLPIKPQSPIGSPRLEHQPIPSSPVVKPALQTQPPSSPTLPIANLQPQIQEKAPPSPIPAPAVAKPQPQEILSPKPEPTPQVQPEILPPKPQAPPKAIQQPVVSIELKNGTSEAHEEHSKEQNGLPARNGSHTQIDKRLQVLMDEVSNKNNELEDMRARMQQYQQKYDAELKKNEKLMDKLEFIKRKEIEERPILEEIVSRETLELVDKLKEENAALKDQVSNLQTQMQSWEKKGKQQLETISQLMSEKNQITQEMQRRIDRILESQAMNIPSQIPSPRPEIPNSMVESAQLQGKDAIRKLLEDKANLENKINEQWETIQSMSKQKTELLTRLANEAQRNEVLIKENARLRNSQAPPSPIASAVPQTHPNHHGHPHANGQHSHAAASPAEIEVVHQSSGGWLTYIPIVGGYFAPAPAKSTRNV